jgi:toxin ParE1/3/4
MENYVLTNKALVDIEEIVDYLAEESVKSALAVATAIHKTCRMIGDIPDIGHSVDSIGTDLQQITVRKYRNYIVFYIITHSVPLILRVIHAKRDLPTLLSEWYGSE